MTQGRVETAEMVAFAQQSVAQIGYSYAVEGAIYSGFFTQQFGDEQDAWEYVDRVKGQGVVVRYHPCKSALSAVRSGDQNALSISNRKSFLAQLVGNGLVELFTHTDRDVAKSLHDWPTIRGRVESVKVTQKRDEDLWYLVSFYTSEIGYSYSVDGNYYAGGLFRTFFREDSARRFAEELKDKDVIVRYSPKRPRVSKLLRQDQPGAMLT